jgi:hypothetical protein
MVTSLNQPILSTTITCSHTRLIIKPIDPIITKVVSKMVLPHWLLIGTTSYYIHNEKLG